MKVILLITAIFISISLQAQSEKRVISNFNACITDSIFTMGFVPIIDKASTLIKGSNIPTKEGLQSLTELQDLVKYFYAQIEQQKKDAEKQPADEQKSKKKK